MSNTIPPQTPANDTDGISSLVEPNCAVPVIESGGLESSLIDPNITGSVPARLIVRHRVFPLFKIGNRLTLAMVDPNDFHAIEEVQFATNLMIDPVGVSNKDYEETCKTYLTDQVSEENIEIDERRGEGLQIFYDEKVSDVDESDATKMINEKPLVRLLNGYFQLAIRMRASDIHFEPARKQLNVRFRVDGFLIEQDPIAPVFNAPIRSRIKVLAKMDIAERRKPQDGSFSIRLGERVIDVRVSTFPTLYGEKIVMRLLDKRNLESNLENLGFSEAQMRNVQNIIRNPNGILLISGPTGSGKSTTLYALLDQIASPERNLVTVEDPIEYEIPGVNQSQVVPHIGYDFNSSLRAILRQDPDVIMVGEIRDKKTADLAVEASLTGHMVMSTIHTNGAVATITRLIEMDIDPYLLSVSMRGVVAQRLVRTLCSKCRSDQPGERPLADRKDPRHGAFQALSGERNAGEGCKYCNFTGYRGRTGIYELMIVDPDLKPLMILPEAESRMTEHLEKSGFEFMLTNGMAKVAAGITTREELARVILM